MRGCPFLLERGASLAWGSASAPPFLTPFRRGAFGLEPLMRSAGPWSFCHAPSFLFTRTVLCLGRPGSPPAELRFRGYMAVHSRSLQTLYQGFRLVTAPRPGEICPITERGERHEKRPRAPRRSRSSAPVMRFQPPRGDNPASAEDPWLHACEQCRIRDRLDRRRRIWHV